MMDYLPGFIAAYSILIVAALSPGPSVAMLLGVGTAQGRGAALIATAGIATGSILLNLATLLGVGLLLEQAAWAMSALRIVGAAYLAWLAYGALRKAAKAGAVVPIAMPVAPASRTFVAGFLLQVTNPKAIVFWIVIQAIGATQGGGAGIVVAFVAGAFVISFTCHGAWALLLSSMPFRAAYARARRWVEATLGVFFAVMAYRMAAERG